MYSSSCCRSDTSRGTIRLFEGLRPMREQGWGWGREWAEARSWGRAGAIAPIYNTRLRAVRGGSPGVKGGNAPGLLFVLLGPAVPASPTARCCSRGLRGIGLRLTVLRRTVLAWCCSPPPCYTQRGSPHLPSVSSEVMCEQPTGYTKAVLFAHCGGLLRHGCLFPPTGS